MLRWKRKKGFHRRRVPRRRIDGVRPSVWDEGLVGGGR